MLLETHEARLAVRHGASQRHGLVTGLGRERDQRRERTRVRRLALHDLDAARLGEHARVHEVHTLLGGGLEQPAQHRRDERRGVVGRRLARDLERERPRGGAGELRREPAERLGEGEVRRDRLGGLRGEQWRVDGVPGAAAVEHLEDLFRDLLGHGDLRLLGRRTQVRRQEGVGRTEERVVRGRRLRRVDVDAGAGDHAVAQRVREILLVDDPAAGDVQQEHAGLHPGHDVPVDHPGRLLGLRDVDGDDVRTGHDLVEAHELDAERVRLLGGDERVRADDRHLHRPGPDGDRLADLAQADDAEGLAPQLVPRELAALPLARLHRGVRLRRVACEPEHQRDRVLRGRDRVARRGVHDGDPRSGGGVEVHVVHADARAADHDQPGARGDHLGVRLHLAAHDERVELRQRGDDLLARRAEQLHDLVMPREALDALPREGLHDQDAHATTFRPSRGSCVVRAPAGEEGVPANLPGRRGAVHPGIYDVI
ncbi:MAG TPA: hypothetical protein VFY23_08845 [Candidatus Limnocylindrales bacterium]|nr:hypothetical protein [Candidatus Limnocylindrales bacterium]